MMSAQCVGERASLRTGLQTGAVRRNGVCVSGKVVGMKRRTSMAQNCMKRRHTEASLSIEESMQSEQIIQAF